MLHLQVPDKPINSYEIFHDQEKHCQQDEIRIPYMEHDSLDQWKSHSPVSDLHKDTLVRLGAAEIETHMSLEYMYSSLSRKSQIWETLERWRHMKQFYLESKWDPASMKWHIALGQRWNKTILDGHGWVVCKKVMFNRHIPADSFYVVHVLYKWESSLLW